MHDIIGSHCANLPSLPNRLFPALTHSFWGNSYDLSFRFYPIRKRPVPSNRRITFIAGAMKHALGLCTL